MITRATVQQFIDEVKATGNMVGFKDKVEEFLWKPVHGLSKGEVDMIMDDLESYK